MTQQGKHKMKRHGTRSPLHGLETQEIPLCPGGISHLVQQHDTWDNIAAQYTVSISTLKQANPDHSDRLHPNRYMCVPGSLAIPDTHTGRRCTALNRTLTAPDVMGVAYLNHFTNVILVVAHGLPAPSTINDQAEQWILWLHQSHTGQYLPIMLQPCSNTLYVARTEVPDPLTTIDGLIISAEDTAATEPHGWRVLVSDPRNSQGPF